MKALVIISALAAATTGALAQTTATESRKVLVDPDFGLTFETPAGFEANMVGQTPEGQVLLTVATTNPALPASDPGGKLCDITFQYHPTFGQGDQDWVNSLADNTGFYEKMAQAVPVPGTLDSSKHFSHRGASAHQFYGQHELGGAFTVAAIPTPEGFALVSCISTQSDADWDAVTPVIEAITVPGQLRRHLVAVGGCGADLAALDALIPHAGRGTLDAKTIALLDAERAKIVTICDGLHAEAVMDQAIARTGHDGSYRALRYDALARIGSDLLTEEQHKALDGGRQQVVETSDEASGDRYVKYMHFIVGLRSL
ncbi:hypothetical protein AAIB41_11555 [Brucella sp. BE17]|uniref:hypothetical protein n=1 Tax=Brucella sp. BE17 TaxID=3142977 RepID=UPI0031BB7AEF